ncbi:MAG: ATP-binding protein [Vicinamibacterales bacterium]
MTDAQGGDAGPRILRAIAIGLIVGAGILSVLSTRLLIRQLDQQSVARHHMTLIVRLLSALTDAETAARGYVITGDADFLEPMHAGLPIVMEQLDAMEAGPELQSIPAQLSRLRVLVERKIDFLQVTVRARQEQGFEHAVTMIRTGEGKATMDAIHSEAAVLQDVYQRALDAQILESKRQARSTTWTVAASSVLALLFGAAAARMTSRDAARRWQAEAALAAERDRLSAIIAAVPYGLVLFDPEANITLRNQADDDLLQLDGNLPVVHARRAAYRMFRTDGRELSPPEWPTRRAVAGKVSVNEELLIARPDGTTVPMIVSAAPIRSSDGSLLGAVAGFQDITHLHEVGRMKNEFVSTVSHELRTPLTSIRGSLQLVLDEKASCSEGAHELLDIALTNTERLIRLINDILDIAKIDSGRLVLRRQAVSPEDLVRQAVSSLRHGLADQSSQIDVRLEPDLPQLEVDPDRLVQSLVNLLSNAVKFSPPSEPVRIAVGRREGAVRFAVTDRGPGIPADKMHLLFGRFQQLEPNTIRRAQGTGLGLAITKAIVEEHGGRVEVHSSAGEGSTFIVVIPVTPSLP